jgi:hypothetical protein
MGYEILESGRRSTQIRHAEHHDRRASFDSTRFGSRADFRALLTALDLPDEPAIEHEKVRGNHAGIRYVWANDRLLMVTGDNPFNLGEPTETRNGVWAGRIGLEGQSEAVDAAIVGIEERRDMTDGDFHATERVMI